MLFNCLYLLFQNSYYLQNQYVRKHIKKIKEVGEVFKNNANINSITIPHVAIIKHQQW